MDQLRVSVRLASIEQFLIDARNRLAILKATITVLMGGEPSADWQPADSLKMPPASREIEIASLSALRSDEIAAQARAAAAAEQVDAARSGYRPKVDAVLGYGTRADLHRGDHEESGFVGIQLTWDVWDFDRTRSRVAEAEAKQQVLNEAATETALQRRLELSNAEASLRSAAAKIDASRPAVEQSQESLRIEQRKYELGQGTITDVLAAQTATNEAESLRARALANHITTPTGQQLRLRDVAEVRASTGPVEIVRQNQVKQVVVRCDPQNTDLATAQATVKSELAELDWPPGYGYTIGGKAKQMAEMTGTVKNILVLAVFFSFIVLAAQFNSLRLPFIVLLAAPFCLAGMGYGLALAGQPFGTTIIIGGLAVELLVALFLVPVLYTWISRRQVSEPEADDARLPAMSSSAHEKSS